MDSGNSENVLLTAQWHSSREQSFGATFLAGAASPLPTTLTSYASSFFTVSPFLTYTVCLLPAATQAR